MDSLGVRTIALTKSFDQTRAVDNLNIEVERGSIFGLLGPNGAGKTTTIAMLLGLLPPSSGTASVLGYDTITQSDDIRQNTGALLEDHGLYEQLTAKENLDYYGRIWRIPPEGRRVREMQLLDSMDLWDRRDDRVSTWSTGMKRRLGLARSLMHHPEMLFLDEPTAGLDVIAAHQVREDLSNLAETEGITIFLTTHNMVEAERLCDRVAVIKHGRLVTVGSPADLRAASGLKLEIEGTGFDPITISALSGIEDVEAARVDGDRLVIDLSAPIDPTPVVRLLLDSGAHVQSVNKDAASLEEVFITLIEEESS